MKLICYVLLLLMLSACAGKTPESLLQERFELLPHKYSQFDFKIAWENKIVENAVLVDGVAWNLRWWRAEGVEIWVSLVDKEGKVLAEEVDLVRPDPLKIGEKSSFSVKLRAKPTPGSKLIFTYRYGAVEDVEGSTFWMQSFESTL